MNSLNFSDNIVKLRHKKKITQEQLADFIGVTKACVSKWETRQSLPDILLLPRLAAFFDVTIDELLGYEPQLSKEQIQKIYRDLAAVFAERKFEEAIRQSQSLVKKYYSCYPFLFQICVLWLNHFMLADSQTRQIEILTTISDLCCHIISNTHDIGLCNDAIILKAMADLQLGKVQEVIEALEDIFNPYRLSSQSDSTLIHAYQLAKEKDKAESFAQISIFLHLLSLIGNSTQYLILHSDDLSLCEEIISRNKKVINIYDMSHLHANVTAIFYYQAAVIYCQHEKEQEALEMLKQYVSCVSCLFENGDLLLHGDDYFDKIDPWFEGLDLGGNAPRDKKLIFESAMQVLEDPAFTTLKKQEEYQKMKKILKKKGESL